MHRYSCLLLEIQVIWQLLLLLYYITQDQRYLPTTPPTRQHRPPPQGNHPLPAQSRLMTPNNLIFYFFGIY